jgi:hypothetical protein
VSVVNTRRAEMLMIQLFQKGISPTEILEILQEDYGFSSETIQELPIYPKGFKDTTSKLTNPDNALNGINKAYNNNVKGETPSLDPSWLETEIKPAKYPYPVTPPVTPPVDEVETKVQKPTASLPGDKLKQNRVGYLFNIMNTLDKPIPEFEELASEVILGSDTPLG